MDPELEFVMTGHDAEEAAFEWVAQQDQATFATFPLTGTMSVRSPQTLSIRPLQTFEPEAILAALTAGHNLLSRPVSLS